MFTCGDCSIHKDILVDTKGLEACCKWVNTHSNLDHSPTHLGSYTMYRTITNLVTTLTVGYISTLVGHTCVELHPIEQPM